MRFDGVILDKLVHLQLTGGSSRIRFFRLWSMRGRMLGGKREILRGLFEALNASCGEQGAHLGDGMG